MDNELMEMDCDDLMGEEGAGPKPLNEEEVQSIVRQAVEDAVSFVEQTVAPDRERAMRYYEGKVDVGHEEGRSSIVSTRIRDTIRQIKPSLMRVFLQSESPVEFIGSNPMLGQMAETASAYVNTLFNNNGGYRLLNDVFHDTLLSKNGIAKVWWDSWEEQDISEYTNLNDQELAMVMQSPDIEVIEHEMIETPMGPSHNIKVGLTRSGGRMMMEAIPPEEFVISADGTTMSNATVVAHRAEMTVGELVEMGFEWDDVFDLDALDGSGETEKYERIDFDDENEDGDGDPALKTVMVTEAYMKMDVEGTGIPQPYKLILGGSKYKVLSQELSSDIPFINFCADPIPHSFFGLSIPDILFNEQDTSTVMMRGVLDNVQLTNNPRIEVLQGMVNIDDLLNNEIGGIVRVQQQGAVQPLAVPFVAGQTLEALQYLDRNCEVKTGVSAASGGLNPDVLQANTSATAAAAMVQANNATMELMARNLAEGGVTDLFTRILKLAVENMPEQTMMRMQADQYQPVNPAMWADADFMVQVNVGLGTGNEDAKVAALQQTLAVQEKIIAQFGPGNGIVGPKEIRNTLADMLRLAGVQNAARYFNVITPEMEQQMAMAAQQGQQQQDPNQALVQAEQVKAQAMLQRDMAKLQQQGQLEAAKLQQKAQNDQQAMQMQFAQDALDRDLERDKLDANIALEGAKLENRAALDTAALYAKINAPRDPSGVIQ